MKSKDSQQKKKTTSRDIYVQFHAYSITCEASQRNQLKQPLSLLRVTSVCRSHQQIRYESIFFLLVRIIAKYLIIARIIFVAVVVAR